MGTVLTFDRNFSLAKSLVTIGQISQQPIFELRFNQIQNSVIRRINKEIDVINQKHDNLRTVERLQKKFNSLVGSINLAEQYRFMVDSNKGRFEELTVVVGKAIDAFSADDNDANLTSGELTDVAAYHEEIVARIKSLRIFKHPDIVDGRAVENVTDLIDDLEGLDSVAGIVDLADSLFTTNDNRKLLDLLETIKTYSEVGKEVTQNTIWLTTDMILSFQAKAFEIEAEITGITVVDARKRIQEIDAVKAKHGDMLRALSISFSTAQAFTQYIANGIFRQEVPKGSILNLFT